MAHCPAPRNASELPSLASSSHSSSLIRSTTTCQRGLQLRSTPIREEVTACSQSRLTLYKIVPRDEQSRAFGDATATATLRLFCLFSPARVHNSHDSRQAAKELLQLPAELINCFIHVHAVLFLTRACDAAASFSITHFPGSVSSLPPVRRPTATSSKYGFRCDELMVLASGAFGRIRKFAVSAAQRRVFQARCRATGASTCGRRMMVTTAEVAKYHSNNFRVSSICEPMTNTRLAAMLKTLGVDSVPLQARCQFALNSSVNSIIGTSHYHMSAELSR
jgi:hypothetical protein